MYASTAPALEATVKISNLPNHLMSDAMMMATLEQAKLDEFVTSVVTKRGEFNSRGLQLSRGEACVTFTSVDAACRCAVHFHGRKWDASGSPVSAQVLTPKPAPKPSPTPAFVPSTKLASKPTKTTNKMFKESSFALSAQAAEFVPGVPTPANPSKKASTIQLSRIGSDVSTEDGDSASSSDERDGAAERVQ